MYILFTFLLATKIEWIYGTYCMPNHARVYVLGRTHAHSNRIETNAMSSLQLRAISAGPDVLFGKSDNVALHACMLYHNKMYAWIPSLYLLHLKMRASG